MDMKEFLEPTPYIDCDAEPVKEKAREIVQGLTAQRKKAIRFFMLSGTASSTPSMEKDPCLSTSAQALSSHQVKGIVFKRPFFCGPG